MSSNSPGQRFRKLLDSRSCIWTTGIHEPLEVKMAEQTGLPFIYVSGYSCSLAYLGKADMGLVTQTEMVNWSSTIAKAAEIPVLADADDGYGGVLNVMRTVEEFELGGLAGINIEDQQFPKRCGHMEGGQCLPIEESVTKIRAAIDARSDPDFFITARTDAISGGGGIDDAIERARRYADVGADMVWCEFPCPNRAHAERFAAEARRDHPDLPLFFNYSSSFDWTAEENPLSFDELGEMGYRVIVVGLGALHAAMRATWDFMNDLCSQKQDAAISLQHGLRGHPTESHHEIGEAKRLNGLEQSYRRQSAHPENND